MCGDVLIYLTRGASTFAHKRRQAVCVLRSPGRFDLAPESVRFVDVELALACQRGEDVLLQTDGLGSLPAVRLLVSADTTTLGITGALLQDSGGEK